MALILGREFTVVQRPLAGAAYPFAAPDENIDLLIFGVTPPLEAGAGELLQFVGRLPFPVLLLVDGKSVAQAVEGRANLACLTKPFNPYELADNVRRLCAPPVKMPAAIRPTRESASAAISAYLSYPYLGRSAATLAERFASTPLPLLVFGERGSGQERVLAAILVSSKGSARRLSINAAEVTEEYLERKSARLAIEPVVQTLPITMVIENLDRLAPGSQSLLLDFCHEADNKFGKVRYLTTANGDLLERVYRGDFLEALYYKVATLTLKLLPLRQRAEEIPLLAEWLARRYAEELQLPPPSFSSGAKRRLSNYLWFGNVHEMETVIARTLAFHRKPHIEEVDLIFDFGRDPLAGTAEALPDSVGSETSAAEPRFEIYGGPPPSGPNHGSAGLADLNVVIHELAHEFKNPMVTIKTFAQLLGERYHDENFRSRFQQVVGDDIARMDDLLEVMIEFADFAKPRVSKVALGEKLRDILQEIRSEGAKRQLRFAWKNEPEAATVQTDEAQFAYILKNLLCVALAEARTGSEIEVEVAKPASLAIRYSREAARVASISHYVENHSVRSNDGFLPLRVLLAKHLIERNGGRFAVESGEEKETLKLEFPFAERQP